MARPLQSLDSDASAIEAIVRPLISTPMSPRRRQKELEALARAGDPVSFRAIVALVGHSDYGSAAVAAMRELQSSELREQALPILRHEMEAGDAERACIAAAVYVDLAGCEAVPVLMELMRRVRTRNERQKDVVRSFAVDLLGEIGTASAQSILISELAGVGCSDWSLEYGSAVVRNLVRSVLTGGKAAAASADTPEPRLAPSVIVAALEAYANTLERTLPEGALVRERNIQQQKIEEARRAAVRVAESGR